MKIMSSTSTDALRLPEIRISDLNIFLACVLRHMFANTRFVWVEINNIGVMNTLLNGQPQVASGIFQTSGIFPRESRYRYQVQCKSHCAADGTATWYLYPVFPSVME